MKSRTVQLLVGLWLLLVSSPTARADGAPLSSLIGFRLRQLEAGSFDRLAPTPDRQRTLEREHASSRELLFKSKLQFRRDGTIVETLTRTRLFLTDTGAKDDGNESVWFDASDTGITLLAAHTLFPGGRVVAVPRKNLVVQTDGSPDLFTDDVQVIIPFESLAPGTISLLEARLVHDPRRSPLPWATIFYPQTFSALEHFEVEVSWDDDSVKPAWRTDHGGLSERKTSDRSVLFELSHVAALPDDPDQPPTQDLLPALIISQPTTWQELGQTLAKVYAKERTSAPAVKKALADLLSPEDTDQTKLEKIHRFVTKNIRYVGFEQGTGGVVPRPSSLTLQRRFGDCKDMTTLFVDMAQMAGLDAYPVLVSTRRERVEKLLVPSGIYFDHLIACAHVSEEEQCVDLTAPSSPHTELPGVLAGSVRLPITEDGSAEPSTLPAPRYGWEVHLDIQRTVKSSGAMSETGSRKYFAGAAASLRGVLTSKDHAERVQWAEEGFRQAFGDKLHPVIQLQNVDNVDAPLEILWTVERPPEQTPKAGEELVDYEDFLPYLTNDLQTANRHQPYNASGLLYVSKIRYELSPEFHIGFTGPSANFSSDFGSLSRSYEKDDAALDVKTRLALHRQHVTPTDLERFNRFLRQMGTQSRIWFGLTR
ncbi:MAG: DUF3857 and transglutaminase domain-containing protein [Myxococcales bacterium]|nr:DUF3857 and transglutaminase domain-containing protein [Myxococcales bacterium]MCB9582689.1 DUF3857 and transglutaminase domain-containing protein [Polyangiaceae bacterium]